MSHRRHPVVRILRWLRVPLIVYAALPGLVPAME